MTTSKRRPRPVAVPPEFFRQLAELAAERTPLVLVTVSEASGSAPGKAGAKMIVTAGATHGTVGGGRVEKAAIARARELLGGFSEPEIQRVNVVQDLGMSCGGSMSLMYETVTPAPRLVIFGAGHISQPLAAVAAVAGFDVTVCDERADWLTEERFPDARERILAGWDEVVDRAKLDGQTFVASVSPGHAFDKEIVKRVAAGALRPRYVGVIGSRRKAAILKKELVEEGIDPAFVEALHIPMGFNIGAVEPREIAVSVVAELVAELRGVNRAEGW
jgi:xanthine dehydrogenase accessory factor